MAIETVTETKIAKVLPLIRVMQLDKYFDYEVPVDLVNQIEIGMKVKVRFSGKLIDGLVMELTNKSDYKKAILPLLSIASKYPLVTEAVLKTIEAISKFYLGSRANLLKLILPPRNIAVEKNFFPEKLPHFSKKIFQQKFSKPRIEKINQLGKTASSEQIKLAITLGCDDSYKQIIVALIMPILAVGKSVLIIVPDRKEIKQLELALLEYFPRELLITYYADLGNKLRYRNYLFSLLQSQSIVIGNRSAAMIPVQNLSLIIMLDDSHTSYIEPRTPYFHTRNVIVSRAFYENLSIGFLSFSRSVEVQRLVRDNWLIDINFSKNSFPPKVLTTYSEDFRIPASVLITIKKALKKNLPILIQVPRKGYVPVLACRTCWNKATCPNCSGQLRQLDSSTNLNCVWCGYSVVDYHCSVCGENNLAAQQKGVERTAEEFGQAFKNIPIKISANDHIIDEIKAEAALVFATPGAEPFSVSGYAAVIILDAWNLLGRNNIYFESQIINDWFNLGRQITAGEFVIVADDKHPVVQALVAWDPVGLADKMLAERILAKLPPAVILVSLSGKQNLLEDFVEKLNLPLSVEKLGPIEISNRRAIIDTQKLEESNLMRIIFKIPRYNSAQVMKNIYQSYVGWLLLHANKDNRKEIKLMVNPIEL